MSVSSAQAKELSDGKVTFSEYTAAYRRYAACDARAGYKILDAGQTNEVLNFRVPDAAVSSGTDDKCYGREFKQVDLMWQTSRQNSSQIAADFRACITKAGKVPASTYPGLVDQLNKLGIDPNSCSS